MEEKREEELLEQEIPPAGKDEMNLAEFPFAVLSDRAEGVKTLQFTDTIAGKDGERVTRRWTVTASDKFGMPTRDDERLYIALMQLTKENGFDSPRQFFTRYRLLDIAGWPHEGAFYYKRVESALDRLMGVTIKAENAFWDPVSRAYTTESFHIIDNYRLYDREDGRKAQATLPLSFFKWNEIIWRSIQGGYIKNLDTAFWFSLKGPITRRLHRYLDKKLYQSHSFKIELKKLALEHIGLARASRPAKLKGFIQGACEELKARGYLEAYSFTTNPAGEQILSFKRAQRRRRLEIKRPPEQPPKLVAELMQRGITEAVVRELVASHDRKRIEEKIELYEYLKRGKSQQLEKNPAGYLRKAIEDDYRPPEGFQTRAQVAAMLEDHRRQEQAQRWHDLDQRAREYAAYSDEERAAGALWMWKIRFKKQNHRDPKPEELQDEKARIVAGLESPEEYRRALFAEAGVPDTPPRRKTAAEGH